MSELSNRITERIEKGEWQEASKALAEAWRAAVPFGKRVSTASEFAGLWVQFKTKGYPFKLRREWEEANDQQTLEIVLRYVEAWNIVDVNGAPVDVGDRSASVLDSVEDSVVGWLVGEFMFFWRVDLRGLRPNSPGPSGTA